MDPHAEMTTAVMARHRPQRLLAFFRIRRCVKGCGRWPCNCWLLAADLRRRHDDQEAIQRITDILVPRPEVDPPNRGHWGRP